MIIRQETPKDYDQVNDLIIEAFKDHKYTNEREHEMVKELRTSDVFIPELSLVAEIEGKVIGHVLFTEALVDSQVVLLISPLAVLPYYQNQGVGKALVLRGHVIGKDLGYKYSTVLGSETYYPQMGYIPSYKYGITSPMGSKDNFMAFKLSDDAPEIEGEIRFFKNK